MTYTFHSIAGYETERRELERLCEILNNRERIEEKGGRMPKGLILYGAPGNGKTLFAKVLAHECRLKMINIDLADCVDTQQISEKINNAFTQASQEEEPVMIFFDELDKVLPNDYEKYYTEGSKTIFTQLLTQIDGVCSKQNVFFVATCNYYEAMPKALVRAGRIDKKMSIGNPTYASRVEILKHYMKRTGCSFKISLEEIAKLTNGMSCAELEALVNECVLSSYKTHIIPERVIKSKIIEIKDEDIERKESTLTSLIFGCRNVGCFVVSREFNDGGYVLSLEEDTVCNNFFDKILSDYDSDYEYEDEEAENESSRFFSSQDLKNAITVIFGGYVAQEMMLGNVYDNVKNQFSIVDDIIDGMVECGMLGIANMFRYGRNLPYSPERLEEINQEVDYMKECCFAEAKKIVNKNRELIEKLVPLLVERKSITKKDCEPLLKISEK